MIDAGLKNLFSWFSAEYPDYILTVSPLFTGVRVKVTKETDSKRFDATKLFLIGRDYNETESAPDKIRAWIPAVIAENKKRGTI